MSKKTIFRTIHGTPVYRADCRMSAADNAMKKAAVLGYDTLIAHTPDGQKHDYTGILHRDYLSKIIN